jgi:glycerol-3-phosphate acyltransferase PlsX
MGGDDAPRQIVEGAVYAARSVDSITCILVGDEAKVRAELARLVPVPKNIEIVHAPSFIDMGEVPVETLKKKRDASIIVAVELVKNGEADALVAAGNTGAVVAGTMLGLNMIEGVKRAGIAAPTPTLHGISYMIDVGANVNCKPDHLVQYGAMASTYMRLVSSVKEPKVGLLSVGKEGQKGNELVKEAHRLFEETSLNFVGNVEGTEIYNGDVDIIVCEGFVGNVILKSSEGYAENILSSLDNIVREKDPAGIYEGFRSKVIKELFHRFDYSTFGGAPLLGVNGVCIICHGRSNARAITNAITVARQCAEHRVTEHIRNEINLLDKATRVS